MRTTRGHRRRRGRPPRYRSGVLLALVAMAAGGLFAYVKLGPHVTHDSGTLRVTVTGLPKGEQGEVVVTGPESFTLAASTTRRVPPGTYRIAVNEVALADKATASGPATEVRVRAGKSAEASGDYTDIVGANTRILDPAHPGVLRVDGAKVHFPRGHKIASRLEPGQYLLSGSSPKMWHPLIRKVTSVDTSGSGIVVTTKPARLHEAMPKYHFNLQDAPATGIARPPAESARLAAPRHTPPTATQAGFTMRPAADEPLFEIKSGELHLDAAVPVGPHTYGCGTKLPPMTWKLYGLDPRLAATFQAVTGKKKVKVRPDKVGPVEIPDKVAGVEIPEHAWVTVPGVKASGQASLNIAQEFSWDGPLEADCYYEYSIVEAVTDAASAGAGKAAKAARKLAEFCTAKVAKSDVLGKLGLACDMADLKVRVQAHSDLGHFQAELPLTTRANVSAAGSTLDPTDATISTPRVSVDGRPTIPQLSTAEKDIMHGVEMAVAAEFTYTLTDPLSGPLPASPASGTLGPEVAFNLTASAGADLPYRPNRQQSLTVDFLAQGALYGQMTLDPLVHIGPIRKPVNIKLGSSRPASIRCRIAGPWYPFGRGDGPPPKEPKCGSGEVAGTFVEPPERSKLPDMSGRLLEIQDIGPRSRASWEDGFSPATTPMYMIPFWVPCQEKKVEPRTGKTYDWRVDGEPDRQPNGTLVTDSRVAIDEELAVLPTGVDASTFLNDVRRETESCETRYTTNLTERKGTRSTRAFRTGDWQGFLHTDLREASGESRTISIRIYLRKQNLLLGIHYSTTLSPPLFAGAGRDQLEDEPKIRPRAEEITRLAIKKLEG